MYDAGALIAAERGSSQMLAIHRRAMVTGPAPVVPTIVLGQVWRGFPRQARLAAVLKGCRTENLDVIAAKLGGQLCGTAGTSDLADAVVALTAVRLRAGVVTSDPDDLLRLTVAAGRQVPILAI